MTGRLRIIRTPDSLIGDVSLPASKSISNRALIIRELCEDDFNIFNLSDADDTTLMQTQMLSDELEKNTGNAGTVMRFLTAYFASRECEVILHGDQRMMQRPIAPLVDGLNKLGADISYYGNKGFAPLHILGRKLQGGSIHIQSDSSSQFTSALVLIAPTMKSGLEINLDGEVVSKPYIHLSLQMISYFGLDFRRNERTIYIPPQNYIPRDIFIESDWTAASYFWALAAIFPNSNLMFQNLKTIGWQGDDIIRKWMQSFGVTESVYEHGIRIRSHEVRQENLSVNCIDNPDLVPTLTVLCCVLNIPFKISGIRTLQYKESNRAVALQTELEKLGFQITVTTDEISCEVFPKIQDKETVLLTYNDHRLAMAFTLLAIRYPQVRIDQPDCVKKSFPGFWKELKKIGFVMLEE